MIHGFRRHPAGRHPIPIFGQLAAAAAEGEELTAEDISGAGFGQDGAAGQMHPGPVLVTLVHAATANDKVLAALSEDDLIGIIRGARGCWSRNSMRA